jgi:hypothetical protein
VLHRIKYWQYRPKWVIERVSERKLTLRRGYSTFVPDEFDFHFNKMAADSLRYHLSPRCVVDNEPRRELYEALIARLEEPLPDLTPQESAAIGTLSRSSEPAFNPTFIKLVRTLSGRSPRLRVRHACVGLDVRLDRRTDSHWI